MDIVWQQNRLYVSSKHSLPVTASCWGKLKDLEDMPSYGKRRAKLATRVIHVNCSVASTTSSFACSDDAALLCDITSSRDDVTIRGRHTWRRDPEYVGRGRLPLCEELSNSSAGGEGSSSKLRLLDIGKCTL